MSRALVIEGDVVDGAEKSGGGDYIYLVKRNRSEYRGYLFGDTYVQVLFSAQDNITRRPGYSRGPSRLQEVTTEGMSFFNRFGFEGNKYFGLFGPLIKPKKSSPFFEKTNR